MPTIADIMKKKAEFEEELQKFGEEALKAEFKAYFDANPKVEAIRWRQYTPYFNDGDACVFRVRDFYIKYFGAEPDSGDYGDGFEYLRQGTGFKLRGIEDEIYEAVFGDHAEITATREGFEVNEYSHD